MLKDNTPRETYSLSTVFTKSKNVDARKAFCARRSNPLARKEIASGWKEHPALAMTHHFMIYQAALWKP
jgi:hypothetical protein